MHVPDDERSDGKLKDFDVTIKSVREVEMSQIQRYLEDGFNFPQDVIQALDIVLRNPSSTK